MGWSAAAGCAPGDKPPAQVPARTCACGGTCPMQGTESGVQWRHATSSLGAWWSMHDAGKRHEAREQRVSYDVGPSGQGALHALGPTWCLSPQLRKSDKKRVRTPDLLRWGRMGCHCKYHHHDPWFWATTGGAWSNTIYPDLYPSHARRLLACCLQAAGTKYIISKRCGGPDHNAHIRHDP